MNELIYKQDAKDAVDMALDTIDHVPEWVYDILLNSLDKVPSAEPERKKGKWIFIHPLQADDEGAYICSNCHRGDWDIKPTDKYCKFCEMEMDIYER